MYRVVLWRRHGTGQSGPSAGTHARPAAPGFQSAAISEVIDVGRESEGLFWVFFFYALQQVTAPCSLGSN